MIEYENLKKVNEPFEIKFKEAFDIFINKGWYILGEQVELFEKEFAEYCNSKFCIGLASGLDALYLSLIVLNMPKGSEVLVPSNTYIATILSIINAGLKPILIEPKIDTYNIDPYLLEQHINPNTRAIMIVHLYGKPCEMNSIIEISQRYGLALIEDCAQSHGAIYKGKKVGTFGILGAFSFYPTKNLGALGDAGAIITDNEELAIKLKSLRNYGSHKKYYNDNIGINSRLDEIQASFLRIKLKSLDTINNHKITLAKLYRSLLKHDEIILPIEQENIEDVYHIFNIRLSKRDKLKEYLLQKGIKTEIHYPVAPNKQLAYRHLFNNQYFPISEKIHATTLSLPISASTTQKEVIEVCSVVNNFLV